MTSFRSRLGLVKSRIASGDFMVGDDAVSNNLDYVKSIPFKTSMQDGDS